MQATQSDLVKPLVVIGAIGLVWLARDTWFDGNSKVPTRTISLSQQWSLQPGDTVADFTIVGGLGDISVAVGGKSIRVPFDGEIQQNQSGCILYSTDAVPAYLFRLCGVKNPRLGKLKQGEVIGSVDYLQFATLRRQPNGTWAFVETSKDILEKLLKS